MYPTPSTPVAQRQQQAADLDVVIAAVARVIEHSHVLQNRAEESLGSLDSATDKVGEAVARLLVLERTLDTRIASKLVTAVEEPFKQAVNNAADRIVADLDTARSSMEQSAMHLLQTATDARRQIEDSASAFERNFWTWMAFATTFGAGLTVLAAGVYHVMTR